MTRRPRPPARAAAPAAAARITTVSFPEPLFLALRTRAVTERTTLRALVVAACEAYLGGTRTPRRR